MFNCSGRAEVKWWNLLLAKCLNCHMVFTENSYTWMYIHMACVSNTSPRGNKMMSSVWCPKWVYSQRLPYLSNFLLFVSYLLFHETEACRKLSPLAADFPFEAIQLVTCEITLSFLLVFFLLFPHTSSTPPPPTLPPKPLFFFFLGKNLDKK